MQIGAHYYPWYKTKKQWWKLTLRGRLSEQHKPTLDWYTNDINFPVTDDWDVVRTHFRWCKEFGIDFLLVSWKDIEMLPYLDIAEQEGIKLSIHYETLGRAKSDRIDKTHLDTLLFDVPTIKQWFSHPAWMHVDGKPLVTYYVARQIRERDHGLILSSLRKAYGDVCIMADEVWWNQPQPERLKRYDGVFGYNMYINKGDKMDKGKVQSKGEISNDYLDLIRPYEEQFYKFCQENGLLYFPTVLPGYNDRAVRYEVDHYAIPREEGEFFAAYLEHATPMATDGYLLVTSFNEWYEDSQIEPVIETPISGVEDPTKDFINGQKWEAYGFKYLEMLREYKKTQKAVVPQKTKTVSSSAQKAVGEKAPASTTREDLLFTTLTQNVLSPNVLTQEELLDYCALLYYQLTIVPELSADNRLKEKIRLVAMQYIEYAQSTGITIKTIRGRAKDITHYFSCNRDVVWREVKQKST